MVVFGSWSFSPHFASSLLLPCQLLLWLLQKWEKSMESAKWRHNWHCLLAELWRGTGLFFRTGSYRFDSVCEHLSQNPSLLSKPCLTRQIQRPGGRPESVCIGGIGLSKGFCHHCKECPGPEEGPKSQVMCKSIHIHHWMRMDTVFYWLWCNNIWMAVLSCQCGGGGDSGTGCAYAEHS